MNTKRNNGDEQQPFIPAGNGSKSGQYTNKTIQSNFIISEGCTKNGLKKLLTKREIEAIRKYTNPVYGCVLNKAIREGTCTYENTIMMNLIIDGIKKHHLKSEMQVYRGIKVSQETYIQNFYNKYINDEVITGSPICSTSRKLERALKGAINANIDGVGIIFETILPKGYEALPVENISVKPWEREILISKPRYRIVSIKNCCINGEQFKRIKIQLEEVK